MKSRERWEIKLWKMKYFIWWHHQPRVQLKFLAGRKAPIKASRRSGEVTVDPVCNVKMHKKKSLEESAAYCQPIENFFKKQRTRLDEEEEQQQEEIDDADEELLPVDLNKIYPRYKFDLRKMRRKIEILKGNALISESAAKEKADRGISLVDKAKMLCVLRYLERISNNFQKQDRIKNSSEIARIVHIPLKP